MHESTLAEIRTAIGRLLPAGVTASAGAITESTAMLAAAELPPTRRMSARRLREFSAGRDHARRALECLGVPAPSLPVGPDRSPRWPAGYIGSISHAGELVLAVAAPAASLRAIGVDLEPMLPLDAELLGRVCRPEELARLHGSAAPAHQAKLIFSAKESVYKCLAPLLGIFLEFEDLEILFDAGQAGFRARGHGPAAQLITPGTVTGGFVPAGGYWITAAWQGAASDPGQAGSGQR